jgi:hypothetical protein
MLRVTSTDAFELCALDFTDKHESNQINATKRRKIVGRFWEGKGKYRCHLANVATAFFHKDLMRLLLQCRNPMIALWLPGRLSTFES